MAEYHLAQLNIARLQAPLDSPQLAGFVAALDPVNAVADRSPGFVWRLQSEDGDATSIQAYDDSMVIINMSVWESVEALAEFAYRSDHRSVLRRRRDWFERMDEAYLVLWWVPAGHLPSIEEAKERLDRLQQDGPSPDAFTFRSPFPAPNGAAAVNTGGSAAPDDAGHRSP